MISFADKGRKEDCRNALRGIRESQNMPYPDAANATEGVRYSFLEPSP